MSFFTKKNFLYKLIVCVCIFLVLINFASPQRSYAASEESGIGGVLITPICNLLLAIGDAIMNVIQKSIMGGEATITVDNTDSAWYEKVWTIAKIALCAIAVCIIITIIPGGWAFVGTALATVGKFILAKGISTLVLYGTACLVIGGSTVNQGIAAVTAMASNALPDKLVLPTYTIGPQEIFSGKILLFDPNIFNPKQVFVEYETEEGVAQGEVKLEEWKKMNDQPYHATGYYYIEDGEKIYTSTNNAASELKDIIAKWYYIIRNIALVGSMLTLLYIGIRMMITSVAADKAKYKQMLSDWVIAICLIVLMHYIMIFAHSIVDSITKILINTADKEMSIAIIDEPTDNLKKSIKDLEEKAGVEYLSEDEKYISWPTNMMGVYRVQSQQAKDNMEHVGFTLAYLALVLFTLVFSFTYIKRLLYLMFLTVIAPFVALTYPIDKIHDGKAQAFDMWLKEYTFNLLIQPFHLILYTIFVTMAFELASTNVIYSLVVLGFMIPAEKFLRTMFGFNKASTPGLLAGPAGAALTMSALGSLRKFANSGHGGKGADGKGQGKEENKNLRTNDTGYTRDALIADLANQGGNSDSGGSREETTNNQEHSNNLNNNNETGRQRLDSERNALDEFEAEGMRDDTEEQIVSEEQQSDIRQQELPSDEPDNNAFDDLYIDEDESEPEERIGLRDRISNVPPVRFVRNTRDKIEDTRDEVISKINSNKKVGALYRGAGALAKTGWKLAKPALGNAARFTANVAAGATLGAVGVAAGMVAGDPNAVAKNAALGATTGVAVSNGVANRIGNDVRNSSNKVDETVTDWKKNFYGAEYEQKEREKLDRQFANDREIRRLYKQKLELKTEKEVDAAMEDAKKYRQYGINDNSVIIKAMKANNENISDRSERTSNKRIAAAMFAENSKGEKELEANMKRFGEKKGITGDQVTEMKNLVRKINNM